MGSKCYSNISCCNMPCYNMIKFHKFNIYIYYGFNTNLIVIFYYGFFIIYNTYCLNLC